MSLNVFGFFLFITFLVLNEEAKAGLIFEI